MRFDFATIASFMAVSAAMQIDQPVWGGNGELDLTKDNSIHWSTVQ